MAELLLKVLNLCYEITQTTQVDVFFYYAAHINCVSVCYYKGGYNADEDAIYIKDISGITSLIKCDKMELTALIDKLTELKSEVQNEL